MYRTEGPINYACIFVCAKSPGLTMHGLQYPVLLSRHHSPFCASMEHRHFTMFMQQKEFIRYLELTLIRGTPSKSIDTTTTLKCVSEPTRTKQKYYLDIHEHDD